MPESDEEGKPSTGQGTIRHFWLTAGLAAIMAALITGTMSAAVAIYVRNGSSLDIGGITIHKQGTPVASSPPSTPTPRASSVPQVVAAGYVGTWTGSATSAPGTYLPPTFAMTIHIRNGGTGAVVGDFTRSNPNCIGRLVLDTVTSSSITMSVPSVEGGSLTGCLSGAQMVLSMESESLGFQWFQAYDFQLPRSPIASGTLTKQAQ